MSVKATVRQGTWALSRVQGMLRFLQLTDRILGESSKITVASHKGTSHIAFTDGENIHINERLLLDPFRSKFGAKSIDSKKLAILKGVNYHELAHNMFTPRKGDPLPKYAANQGSVAMMILNVIEDCRIELLFGNRYPSTVDYFNMAVADIILNSDDSNKSEMMPFTWFLVYGRRFNLDNPAAVNAAEAELLDFFHPLDRTRASVEMQKWREAQDRFLTCVFPTNTQRGIAALKDAHDAFETLRNIGNSRGNSDIEPDDLSQMQSSGRPSVKKQKESMDETVEKLAEESSEADDESDGSDAAGEDADTASEESDTDSVDSETGSNSPEDETDDSGEDSTGGESASSGTPGAAGNTSDDGLKEQIESMMKDIMGKDQVLLDLDANKGSIESEVAKARSGDTSGKGRSETVVETGTRLAMKDIVSEFKKLRTDLDPSWVARQNRGKLNINHLLLNEIGDRPTLDVFDQWDEGDLDAGEVEVFLGVDVSASMASQYQEIGDVSWAVKSSCDAMEWKCVVSAWNADQVTLIPVYGLDERASSSKQRMVNTGGGTIPAKVMREALTILAQSPVKQRLFIIFTDGEWQPPSGLSYESLLRNMQRAGITTVLIEQAYGYGGNYSSRSLMTPEVLSYFDVHEKVNMVADVPEVFKHAVKALMKRSLQGA